MHHHYAERVKYCNFIAGKVIRLIITIEVYKVR